MPRPSREIPCYNEEGQDQLPHDFLGDEVACMKWLPGSRGLKLRDR